MASILSLALVTAAILAFSFAAYGQRVTRPGVSYSMTTMADTACLVTANADIRGTQRKVRAKAIPPTTAEVRLVWLAPKDAGAVAARLEDSLAARLAFPLPAPLCEFVTGRRGHIPWRTPFLALSLRCS
jgi:hypothetical protein